MKKNILISAPPLFHGGITSSLLSLLGSIDYDTYDVDLILMRSEGEYLDMLPDGVNLLVPALSEKNPYIAKLKKFFIYLFCGFFFRLALYRLFKKKKYKNGEFQLMSGLARCRTARRLEKHYDIAVGYMEGFADDYIAFKTNAERKIGFIHVDYENAGLDPVLDRKVFSRLDRIALVSEINKAVFDRVFPESAHKSAVVENILLPDVIRSMSKLPANDFKPSPDCFNIVTAARLDIAHKGLDRGVYAIHRLKSEGVRVRWYIFGDGADRAALYEMICRFGLEKDCILMGRRKNVYPYIASGDIFLLPSVYEGRPIAVSEAQILGVVPVVTKYLSAPEQITDGFDGIILENNTESVYNGVRRLIDDVSILDAIRSNLKACSKSFDKGMDQFYSLIEQPL